MANAQGLSQLTTVGCEREPESGEVAGEEVIVGVAYEGAIVRVVLGSAIQYTIVALPDNSLQGNLQHDKRRQKCMLKTEWILTLVIDLYKVSGEVDFQHPDCHIPIPAQLRCCTR